MAIFNSFANKKNIVKACDFTKKIKELTASGSTKTWTANKDCWLHLSTYIGSGYTATIKINGVLILSGGDDTFVPCLYVTKGSVIELYSSRESSSSAKMIAYGCL